MGGGAQRRQRLPRSGASGVQTAHLTGFEDA
jgi:hypothetical protein